MGINASPINHENPLAKSRPHGMGIWHSNGGTTSLNRVCRLDSWLWLLAPASSCNRSWEAALTAQVVGFLTPTWRPGLGFQLPIQPSPVLAIAGIWGVSHQMGVPPHPSPPLKIKSQQDNEKVSFRCRDERYGLLFCLS